MIELTNAFFGALFGAFFAFFLHIILKRLDDLHGIKRANFVAVVKIQHSCVRYDHAISWNIKELKNFKAVLSKTLESDILSSFYIVQPKYVHIDYELLTSLTKVSFVRDALDLFLSMDDINSIVTSLKEANKVTRVKLDNSEIPKDLKKAILQGDLDRIDAQIQQLLDIRKRIYKLLSKIYVLAPKYKAGQMSIMRKILIKFRISIDSDEYAKEDKESFDDELKKLEEIREEPKGDDGYN